MSKREIRTLKRKEKRKLLKVLNGQTEAEKHNLKLKVDKFFESDEGKEYFNNFMKMCIDYNN